LDGKSFSEVLQLTNVPDALAYFLPIILRASMGFSYAQSQCLVAPPYVLAGIVMFTGGYLGDRYHLRGPIVVFNNLLCIIGLPIMGWATTPAARYFGVFLVTAGAMSNVPATMSYQANNIRGQWKRAFCSATMIGAGGIGGMAGSLVFRAQDSPTYRPGLYACLTASSLSIVLVGLLSLSFFFENRKAARDGKELETSQVN
jgi:predicted MFS family arabinose efflux permease